MPETEKNMSFSLAGCGFLGIYHIGAAACLCKHVPHLLENAKFCGASAGALISCSLICHVPMDQCVDFTLRLASSSGQYPLGGWEPNINIQAILRQSIEQVLPANAHELCTDRLFISITSISKWKNQIVSKFRTRQELIDALMCSAYVPAFSSYTMPQFGGEYVIDGGLSDNLPVLDGNTITICPWAGEHSICPQDPEGQSFPITILNMSFCPSTQNLARFKDAFFSPQIETLKNYCWQGYDDALRFLKENHLIHCTVHRVLAVLTNLEQRRSMDCADCEHCRAHAHNSQLPDNIASQFSPGEKSEWWGSKTVWLEPCKKVFNIFFTPLVIFKEIMLQLFFMAYFKLNKIRNGGMSAEVIRLIQGLCKPKEFMWDICVFMTSKSILESIKCWTRFISEVFALVKSVRFSSRVVCHEICHLCGNVYSKAAGAVTAPLPEGRKKDIEAAAKEQKTEVGVEDHPHQQEASPKVQAEPNVKVRVDPAGAEAMGSSVQELADSMAVLVDIHAESFKMALPLLEANEEESAQAAETVQVEGLGEIKEVVIDPVVVVHPPTDQAEGAAKGGDVSQQQSERIHQYVHKLDQLRNIMTLHYIDENHQRHTESLFVEEIGSRAVSQENLAPPAKRAGEEEESPEQARKVSWEDIKPVEGAEGGVREHDVDREVRQLLEKKLFSGQRQFEKDYETSHQLRLKKKGKREVRTDTGHFSLQLISFASDAPSTPDLSRSSSQLSVNVDEEGELVRSVSDACTLASSLRKLRERKARRATVESPLCASCSSLQEPPPSNLATSTLFPSLQSLPKPPRALLFKSQSDTSEVAASLRALRSRSRSPVKEGTGKRRDQHGSVRKSRIPRVATTPCLAAEEGAWDGNSGGTLVSQSADAVSHPLTIIHDDPSSCHRETIPDTANQGEPSEGKVDSGYLQGPSSSGRSGPEHKVKVGQLERSCTIHGSGQQKTELMSNLQELRAESHIAEDTTPASSTSTSAVTTSTHTTPHTTSSPSTDTTTSSS